MKKRLLTFLLLVWYAILPETSFGQTFTLATGTGTELGGAKDGGAVWADFDNDDDLDLLVNTSNGTLDTRLFQSDGGSPPTFTDVTTTLADGLLDNTCERSIIWGDLNNDGYQDFIRNTHSRLEIYINGATTTTPNYRFGVGAGMTPNITFTQLSVDGCSQGDGINSEGVALIDYNNDGWLDIVIENAECGIDVLENMQQDDAATINTTFGDGNMNTEAEATTNGYFNHVSVTGNTLGLPLTSGNGDYIASGDYNADGYVDFIARKPTGTYDLWENDGDDTFSANTTFSDDASTAAANGNKGGAIFCDFDLDGDLDIFWSDAGTNQIWLQHPTGTFTASSTVSVQPVLPGGEDIDGCACADVDQDGDVDLFLGNDSGNSYLYINTTSAQNDISSLSFTRTDIAVNADAEGVNLVDYDSDGDYDIYINVNGANNQLWENDFCDGGGCNFLEVFIEDCLDGDTQTRPVVGASMVIRDDMGDIVSAAQSGSNSAGHGAQNPPATIFGLPDMVSDYTIDITFPEKDGVVESYSYDFNAGDIVDNQLTLIAVNSTGSGSCEEESVLPVDLISFRGFIDGSIIKLEWTTANELNNSHFEIERSRDGKSFEKIGEVIGNGTINTRNYYSFYDNMKWTKEMYYRLKQVDYDGSFEYSWTISVHTLFEQASVTIYPNPSSEIITVNLTSQIDSGKIQIVDINGRLVNEITLGKNTRLINIDVSGLYSGIYFLKTSNRSSPVKFAVKQD